VGREEDPALVREEKLPRNAPMSGMFDALGMCNQLVDAGACESALVAVGEGTRCGEPFVTESSGSGSIGTWAMRVRACRRGGWGGERKGRDRPGSKSGEAGRAEDDLNDGVNRRGKRRESVLRARGALGGVMVCDCAVADPKREYSALPVFGSDSRSGTDASTEMLRLWTSRRLWADDGEPELDTELLTSLGRRLLKARRRANGTRIRMAETRTRKPPTQATMMIVRLFLSGGCDGVADPSVGLRSGNVAWSNDPSQGGQDITHHRPRG
jgi:hypothetical protein